MPLLGGAWGRAEERPKTYSLDGWDCSGAVCFRALRSAFFLLKSITICLMERTLSGRLFLKCLKNSSSMNWGRDVFQGSSLKVRDLFFRNQSQFPGHREGEIGKSSA